MTVDICVSTGKVRHSRENAAAAARSHRRRWLSRMGHYKCTACGSWHIGNERPRKPRRARR